MGFSFRRDHWQKIPRGLLGMLVLVAIFESFVARNDRKFSRIEAEDWKCTARVAQGGLPPGGIFCYGDSQVKFGISPLRLEAKLGQPSECLALQGGQAPASYFLLRKTLESGVTPSVLIVDFEPHLLRDGIEHNRRMWAELADLGECLELAWNAGDADAFASMALSRTLASYRQRSEIRDNLKAALRGETPGMASWLDMAARNRGMNRGALAIAKQPHGVIDVANWANPTPQPWKPNPVNDLYARRFLKLAADHKIPVYCLLMPVAAGLQKKYQDNGMNEHYFAWLRRLQQKNNNLYVLDWRQAGYQDHVFTDALHLDRDGALAVTDSLGDYLQRVYKGEGVDVRWVAMPTFRNERIAFDIEDSNRSNDFLRSSKTRRR